MIPRTEQELEAYFLLLDVVKAKERRHIQPYGMGASLLSADHYEKEYQRIKQEYLKLVSETPTTK